MKITGDIEMTLDEFQLLFQDITKWDEAANKLGTALSSDGFKSCIITEVRRDAIPVGGGGYPFAVYIPSERVMVRFVLES